MTDRLFDYYWSDTHFGHKLMVQRGYRPFDTVEEMNHSLIVRYNSVVSPADTVALLGDTFFTSVAEAKRIMGVLNGRKVLIWGGHDKSFSAMLNMGFSAVAHQMEVLIAGRVCMLCHFPHAGTRLHNSEKIDNRYAHLRPLKKRGQVLIHGHTHRKCRVEGTSVHVGVEAWDVPVHHSQIEQLVEKIFAGGKK